MATGGKWQRGSLGRKITMKQNVLQTEDIPNIKLRCRGNAASPDGACVENYSCYNATQCKYVDDTTGSGEIICMCGSNHQ